MVFGDGAEDNTRGRVRSPEKEFLAHKEDLCRWIDFSEGDAKQVSASPTLLTSRKGLRDPPASAVTAFFVNFSLAGSSVVVTELLIKVALGSAANAQRSTSNAQHPTQNFRSSHQRHSK